MNYIEISGVTLPDLDAAEPVFWKSIPGYEKYYVCNLGLIYNTKSQRYVAGWLRGGYKAVALCKKGKPRTFTIHSLVARAFIPNPLNKPVIDHIDGQLNNNNARNLRWATYSENGANRGKPKANKSGYKGVSLHAPTGKYIVHVNRKHIGLYDTAEAGYAAYCTAAREIHGEFFHA